MTEYGRGPGSEPWHPEDPLYGDQGWGGRDASGQGGYDAGQQQYPQGQGGEAPYGHQQPYQGGYDQQRYGHQQHQHQQQYGTQGGGQQYDSGQYDTGQYAAQQHQQQYGGGQPYDPSWDTSQQTAVPYGADQAGGYGGAPAGYGSRQEADYYGTTEAYPPPEPPARRGRPAPPPPPEPEAPTDWDAEAAKEEDHPFFTGQDAPSERRGGRRRDEDPDDDGYDDEDDDPDERHDGGGGRGKGKRKSRNGLACLVVAAVLVGGAGGAAYFGYQFWQNRDKVEDFAGAGSGQAVVEIPKGATGAQIGQILKAEGVVKSVDAFIQAQNDNPKGTSIQDGGYVLKKEMSGKAAVELMLDPASRDNLVFGEGTRNARVYELVDKRLELKPGTTAKVAKEKAGTLGLPDWAKGHKNVKDPLEGFLFPAAYPAPKGTAPEVLLKKMVNRANQEYEKADLEGKAQGLGLKNPWELLTVASLVQVEGKTEDDFRKMSEVVYNRLKPTNTETNQLLQFDSAFNYLKGQSNIDISEAEINKNQDPYNTYTQRGLTPGPISNPGNEAITAALSPTEDGWMYFVATDGMEVTEFAKNHDDFLKLKKKFNDS
ncbi:endolytic transglycosylase MltG [Streptomyces sp. NPDC005805]|uniref:endolytic transglycosylase MltG n=1 Tax=Streptomyces sp. NPDC005805 TaxID=3157068 RepID=UPI0033D8B78A